MAALLLAGRGGRGNSRQSAPQEEAGFERAEFTNFSGGVAALHTGRLLRRRGLLRRGLLGRNLPRALLRRRFLGRLTLGSSFRHNKSP